MKAVLFDMDGTMLKTENIAIPAFQMTFAELRKRGLYSGETPSEEKFLKQLGNTLEAIWETILPNTDWETRLLADRIMLESELEIIRSGGLTFFPGVEDTLRLLKKKGYDLFVASNGLENYISAIVEHSGFGELFTDLYSAGRFQTKTKVDLVAKLLRDYPVTTGCMVGDRKSDVEAGIKNNLPTIGCLFGYGGQKELEGATYIIESFSELPAIIQLIAA